MSFLDVCVREKGYITEPVLRFILSSLSMIRSNLIKGNRARKSWPIRVLVDSKAHMNCGVACNISTKPCAVSCSAYKHVSQKNKWTLIALFRVMVTSWTLLSGMLHVWLVMTLRDPPLLGYQCWLNNIQLVFLQTTMCPIFHIDVPAVPVTSCHCTCF